MNNNFDETNCSQSDNTKEIYMQMENEEVDGEIPDKDFVLELFKFSTLPRLYMTEDIQKDIGFYRKVVKTNGMTRVWDVSDVCDGGVVLDAIKP